MGSYKCGYNSLNRSYDYNYPTYNPTYSVKPLYPYRIPIDPFTGALKGTPITTHEPPSIGFRAQGLEGSGSYAGD